MGWFSTLFGKKSKRIQVLDEEEIRKRNMKDPEYRRVMESIEWQDQLIAKVQAARSKYEEDKNIDELIGVYEFVLLKARPPIKNMRGLCLALVELYRKNHQNDKAWGYLNNLTLTRQDILDKIRFEQCKILKAEKKYTDAMRFLMCGYLHKSKWNNQFQKEMFVKEASTIANRLKWNRDQVEYLAYLIEQRVGSKNYNEGSLIESYEKALVEFGSRK